MKSSERSETGREKNPDGQRNPFEIASGAFELIDAYQTPPFPSTYALWYAYVSGSNEALVARVDEVLAKNSELGPYEINEICETFLTPDDVRAANAEIGRRFKKEMSDVIQLIQTNISDTERFQDVLGDAARDLPEAARTGKVDDIVANLIQQNQEMAARTAQLAEGMNESQRQIEALNRELEIVQKQSMTDPLTGLLNRRVFDERIREEIELARKHNAPLCLAMIDLDHFKRINDSFGHLIGDAVLKKVAGIISAAVRPRDIVARFGGEEFAVIFTGANIPNASVLVNRIRRELSNARLYIRNTRSEIGTITASFGVVDLRAEMDAEDMVEAADALLYVSKQDGRNRVSYSDRNMAA